MGKYLKQMKEIIQNKLQFLLCDSWFPLLIFLMGDLALDGIIAKYLVFLDISRFSKILGVKSFGNS